MGCGARSLSGYLAALVGRVSSQLVRSLLGWLDIQPRSLNDQSCGLFQQDRLVAVTLDLTSNDGDKRRARDSESRSPVLDNEDAVEHNIRRVVVRIHAVDSKVFDLEVVNQDVPRGVKRDAAAVLSEREVHRFGLNKPFGLVVDRPSKCTPASFGQLWHFRPFFIWLGTHFRHGLAVEDQLIMSLALLLQLPEILADLLPCRLRNGDRTGQSGSVSDDHERSLAGSAVPCADQADRFVVRHTSVGQ